MGYNWNSNNICTLLYEEQETLPDLHWMSQVLFGLVRASLKRIEVNDTDCHSTAPADASRLVRKDIGLLLSLINHPDYSAEVVSIIVEMQFKDNQVNFTINTADRTTLIMLRTRSTNKFFKASADLLEWGMLKTNPAETRLRARRMRGSTEIHLTLISNKSPALKN